MMCSTCNLSQKPCMGRCACSVDGASHEQHSAANYCADPAGPRFGTGEKPSGWIAIASPCSRCGGPHKLASCPIPEDWIATPQNAIAGGCGCDGSQTKPDAA